MNFKKALKFSVLALASVALLAACAGKSSQETSSSSAAEQVKTETIKVATVGTTKPFSYVEGDDLTGYDIEVLKAVFEGADQYELEFEKTAWSSIFSGLDGDRYQIGANNISFNAERAEKYLYTYPIATNPLVLIVHKDSDIKSYDDIAGHSTQVVQGTSTAISLEEFNKENPDNKVEINYTKEDLQPILQHVQDGQYDFKIFEKISAETIISEQGFDNLKVIDLPSESNPNIYPILAEGQEDLQAFINGRIEELYEDGTLAELSEEFLGGVYLPEKSELKVPTLDKK